MQKCAAILLLCGLQAMRQWGGQQWQGNITPLGLGPQGWMGQPYPMRLAPAGPLQMSPMGSRQNLQGTVMGAHFRKNADMAAILRLTQLFDPANPCSVLRDGRMGCAELDTSPSDTLCVLTSPTSLV